MSTPKPTTAAEAASLAEMWDEIADNETDDEQTYHRPRAKAAAYRATASRLPRQLPRPSSATPPPEA